MLNEQEIPAASDAVREFRVALSNLFLYSEENAMVSQSMERFGRALGRLFEGREEITLGLSDGRLVVESTPLDEHATGSTNMLRDLFRTHELHSLTFRPGLATDELLRFGALLKPKGLPPGVTLTQAVQEAALEHLSVNHRVFVAMEDGSAAALAMGREDDGEFGAAMEALQYFLQVFSRVRPDGKKREMARLVGENLGGWIPPEVLFKNGAGPSDPSDGGEGVESGKESASLTQVLEALRMLTSLLKNANLPEGSGEAVADVEEALGRLLATAAQHAEDAATEAPENLSGKRQEALFETDPVRAALERGDTTPLREARFEKQVARWWGEFQDCPRENLYPSLWGGIWGVIQDPDPEIQVLGLRHLNRWKWEFLPREYQLDGFKRLARYLSNCRTAAAFQPAMLLTYGWMAAEWKSPDYPSFNEILGALVSLEQAPVEAFADQKNKVRLTLQGLFYQETLLELLARSAAGEAGSPGALETWNALGPRAGTFLVELLLSPKTEAQTKEAVFGVVERMQFSGRDVLAPFIGGVSKPARLDLFLGLFDRVIMTGGVANRLRALWDTLNATERERVLEVAARWRRKEFRDVALQRIASSSQAEALHALRLFSAFAREGDSRELLQVVENRSYEGRGEKEVIYTELCAVLGRLTESLAIPTLQDWIQAKGLLDKLKEKSVAVKRAAIQALGQYRSHQVRIFLERYAEHGERDLRPAAQSALQAVLERMAEN